MLRRCLLGLVLLVASATLAHGQNLPCVLQSDCPPDRRNKEIYRCENGQCRTTVCGIAREGIKPEKAIVCRRKFKTSARCGPLPKAKYLYCIFDPRPGTCSSDNDCSAGQLCNLTTGVCETPQCKRDRDCALGQVCERGGCVGNIDADGDRDGVPDDVDNCPQVRNPDQSDIDENGAGDKCDQDMDGDTIVNMRDNCPKISNPGQRDRDSDNDGDACDGDRDNDGIPNVSDECPLRSAGIGIPPDHSGCPPS